MAGQLYLSNRLRALQDAADQFGTTVADNRQLQLQNTRQANIDAENSKLRDQQLKLGNVNLSEAERARAKGLELDALGQQLSQADAAPEDDATRALKDRLRAKMFTTTGTPTLASELAQKRELANFQTSTLKNDETRKQGKYQSELANDKIQREYYAALSGKAVADANRPKPSDIPIDVKAEVSALSGKTAGKVSIANQIDSYIKEFDNAKSADDKVRIGRQMLKVLNSPEGADAVGAEEAKRLGDALEYHMGNVGSLVGATPGKFIGRDLEGFGRQAKATLESVRGSVNANRDEVSRLMGRDSANSDPRVQAALQAGYTMDEIRQYLGGR